MASFRFRRKFVLLTTVAVSGVKSYAKIFHFHVAGRTMCNTRLDSAVDTRCRPSICATLQFEILRQHSRTEVFMRPETGG